MAASGGVLRELLAVFGFDVDTSKLKEGETQLDKFVGKLQKLGNALAGYFAVSAIEGFADSNVRAMQEIEHAADRLGISADEVQSYTFAAKSLGMEGDTLINMMGRLQVAQQAAAQGGQQQAGAFSKIGVSLRGANGEFKEADQLFMDVADGIAKAKTPSEQAALAVKLFGRQGRELLPILKKGSAGLDEFIETYHKLGGGYSQKAIEASKEYTKETAKLDLVTKSLKSTFLVALLPILQLIVKGMTNVVVWFRELTKHSEIVKATLTTLGAVAAAFAINLAIDFAPVLLIAAALAALTLIIDDLFVLFEGGDSAIGDTIDAIWGKDAHLETVRELKDIWEGIGGAIKTSWEYLLKFFGLLTTAGGAIGDFLGKIHNAFGADADKRAIDIAVNRFVTRQRAEVTTKETRHKATEKLEREALGETPVNPVPVLGEPGIPASVPAPEYKPPDFAPRVDSTPPALQQAPADYVSIGDVAITVNAQPQHDERKIADMTVEAFRKLSKAERRAAKATFQTAPAQK